MNDFDAQAAFEAIAKGNADWAQKIAQDAAPAPKILVKDHGLSYLGDQKDNSGVLHSVYLMAYEGTKLFNVWVDLSTEAAGPAGHKCHPIRIVSIDGMTSIDTNGIAVVAQHNDVSGCHVDGQSVASYVLPRALRFVLRIAKF